MNYFRFIFQFVNGNMSITWKSFGCTEKTSQSFLFLLLKFIWFICRSIPFCLGIFASRVSRYLFLHYFFPLFVSNFVFYYIYILPSWLFFNLSVFPCISVVLFSYLILLLLHFFTVHAISLFFSAVSLFSTIEAPFGNVMISNFLKKSK